MLRLTCPQCSSELEIDEGFRGGVCRCFNCGTMMTVPDIPGTRPAVRRGRPDRPDDPLVAQQIDEETARQRGGGRPIPIARRPRKGLRLGVTIGLCVLMAALVLAVLYAMRLVFAGADLPSADAIYRDIGKLTVNPLLDSSPQFLSVPMNQRTIIMIDGSSSMRDYIDPLKQAAIVALSNLDGQRSGQIIIWNEADPIRVPTQVMEAEYLTADLLKERLQAVRAGGGLNPIPAVTEAVNAAPTSLVLALASLPPEQQINEMRQLIVPSGARLDVILLDNNEIRGGQMIRQLAEATGGQVLEISRGELRRWYDQWLAQTSR